MTKKKAIIWALQARESGELTVSSDSVGQIVRMWEGLKPSVKRDVRIVPILEGAAIEHLDIELERLVLEAFCDLFSVPSDLWISREGLPRLTVLSDAQRRTRKAVK